MLLAVQVMGAMGCPSFAALHSAPLQLGYVLSKMVVR
jgi:hypothetical protein